MMNTLKTEFEVASLDKADVLLTKIEKELKEVDTEIEKDYTELTANYKW